MRLCRGMCMLLGDSPGGGPPNVLQAGQNTLWVSGTPFSDDGESPMYSQMMCHGLHRPCVSTHSAACRLLQEVRTADQPISGRFEEAERLWAPFLIFM